jgi:nucleotide-binding universal stress UspA family protein
MSSPAAHPVDREDYGPADRPTPFERGTDGPRTIVAGVDGSPTSLHAAAYACGLARRQRSRLVVAYVAAPSALNAAALGIAAGAEEQTFDDLARDLRCGVRDRADEYQMPITFMRLRGDPYTELCKVADDVRADMLVVGLSTSPGHRLMGSIATKLVKTGRWPVVVVP